MYYVLCWNSCRRCCGVRNWNILVTVIEYTLHYCRINSHNIISQPFTHQTTHPIWWWRFQRHQWGWELWQWGGAGCWEHTDWEPQSRRPGTRWKELRSRRRPPAIRWRRWFLQAWQWFDGCVKVRCSFFGLSAFLFRRKNVHISYNITKIDTVRRIQIIPGPHQQ